MKCTLRAFVTLLTPLVVASTGDDGNSQVIGAEVQ